jgi:hypothetical protein
MRRLPKLGKMLAVLPWGYLIVAMPSATGEKGPDSAEESRHPGRITGVVVGADSGKPVAGAYVGVGDFGDAGGSNLGRFREQGIYAHTETDENGRFVLAELALGEHPLVVTHGQFVRHDQLIGLTPDRPEAKVEVRLESGAKLGVTVLDAAGKPAPQQLIIRLEALDGHAFIPPGRQRHLSAFASPVWTERRTTGSFLFSELAEGEYSIDVMQMTRTATRYYGGIDRVEAKAGETQDVRVKPTDYQTRVTLRVPKFPDDLPREVPAMAVISRNAGLLLWDDGLLHGLEDHRLGRISLGALIYGPASPGEAYQVNNLPPGTYSFFVGPVVALKGVKVEVVRGQETSVEVPWVKPEKVARVGLWRLNRRVGLPAKEYTAEELCALLTAEAKPGPEFKAHPSIRGETLRFGPAKTSLWDVLEKIYLDKGWTLVEEGEKTLILGSPSKLRKPAARSGGAARRQRALSQRHYGRTSSRVPGLKYGALPVNSTGVSRCWNRARRSSSSQARAFSNGSRASVHRLLPGWISSQRIRWTPKGVVTG